MSIADAVDALRTRIDAAGVPATDDPQLVGPLLAAHPVVAYLDAPTVDAFTMGGSLEVSIPVHIAARPPAGKAELAAVWAVLPGLLHTLRPPGGAAPETFQLGDQTLPAYLLTARVRTSC